MPAGSWLPQGVPTDGAGPSGEFDGHGGAVGGGVADVILEFRRYGGGEGFGDVVGGEGEEFGDHLDAFFASGAVGVDFDVHGGSFCFLLGQNNDEERRVSE